MKTYHLRTLCLNIVLSITITLGLGSLSSSQIIINHNCTKLNQIPLSAIQQAKSNLRIAYGHTSHGSQLTDGMTGLTTFSGATYGGSTYAWNGTGAGGALYLKDYYGSWPGGASDLGNPNFTLWYTCTRDYLNNSANSTINVVMWSWCGELASATPAQVTTYLTQMNQLEIDFPNVKFVYMTQHLDYWNHTTVMAHNQIIRDYCNAHNKTLYDFADIESYDPDGTYYPYATDGCDYYSDWDNHYSGNWATNWQNSHTQGTDWYDCGAAHSLPLNANQKAYAAWWLFARLAGWSGTQSPVELWYMSAE